MTQYGQNGGTFPVTRGDLRQFHMSIPARLQRIDLNGRLTHVVTAVLLITPVLLQALLVVPRFLNWRPVWAWYPDPGYQYLWAGGSLVNGGTTDLIFHPGTSFQWLIGASQAVTHLVAGQDSIMIDVAIRPEFYSQTAGI